MFCDKCGTRVDDGQPFCPNCGNRLGAAAPAAPAYNAAPGYGAPNPYGAAPAARAPRPGSPLLAKFNSMSMLSKLFLCGSAFLLLVTMIMSWLKAFAIEPGFEDVALHLPMVGGTWLMIFTTLFHTIAIGIIVLYVLGKIDNHMILLAVTGMAAIILIMLVIKWIAGATFELEDMTLIDEEPMHLTFAGWIWLLFQLGAIALSVLGFLEESKR